MSYILEIYGAKGSLELVHHCPRVVVIFSMCEWFVYGSFAQKSARAHESSQVCLHVDMLTVVMFHFKHVLVIIYIFYKARGCFL